MRIKKSRLLQIISEEIDNDIIFEESEIERIDRWKSVLDDKDPKNDNKFDKEEGFKDFKKGRAIVQKMLDQIDQFGVVDTKGSGTEEEGTVDAEHLTEFIAAIGLSQVLNASEGFFSNSGVPAPYDQIISSGFTIVVPTGVLFQLFDSPHWRPTKDGSTTPLPFPAGIEWMKGEELYGCQAIARALVAGAIYKAIYEVYSKFGGKLLQTRLLSVLGRKRLPILSLMSTDRLQKVISIAVTAKIMRLDEGSQISGAIKDVEESVCKIDSFRSAIEEIISLAESLINNAPAVVKATTDEIKDMLAGGSGSGGGGGDEPSEDETVTTDPTDETKEECPVGFTMDPITNTCVEL